MRELDRENLPKFNTHSVGDIENVWRVSKFRSAAGHSYTAELEECQSMKHYVDVVEGLDPEDMVRYAPVDGTIVRAQTSYHDQDFTFDLVPDDYPEFTISQFHVTPDDGIEVGAHVSAGDRLGVYSLADMDEFWQLGEIGILQNTPEGTTYVSHFRTMTDEVFDQYRAQGADSREQFIISKEERAAEPLSCTDKAQDDFLGRANVDESKAEFNDWVESSDNYVYLRPVDAGPGT